MLEGSRCLVAGATGFIGSHFAEQLLARGARVRATRRRQAPRFDHPALEWVDVDLRDEADCAKAVEGIDHVFVCAAETSGAAVIRATPLAHVTPNVVMNARLLEAAHRAGVRKLLFLSSCAAYPATGERPTREEDMFAGEPEDVYYAVAWMKRYAEILCRTYAEHLPRAMDTVVIRPSNVYGPRDDFEPATSHMTAALVRKVVERQDPLEVWGTGQDLRDLIYVDDLVAGALTVFERSGRHTAVNLASGETSSVLGVLEALVEIDGYEGARIVTDPSKPSTTPLRLVDAGFAKREFGWEARVSLRDGLARTCAWYRATA